MIALFSSEMTNRFPSPHLILNHDVYGPIAANKLGHKLEHIMRKVCTDRYILWKTMHYPRELYWQGMGELTYLPLSTLRR